MMSVAFACLIFAPTIKPFSGQSKIRPIIFVPKFYLNVKGICTHIIEGAARLLAAW